MASAAVDRSLGSAFPLTIQINSYMALRQDAVLDWLATENPSVKRLGLVYYDDPVGRGLFTSGKAKAVAKGYNIVGEEFYPVDLKDYGPLITRALRSNPEALDLGGMGAHGQMLLALTKELYDQSYKGAKFSLAADRGPMIEGASKMEGFTAVLLVDYTSQVISAPEREVIQRFVQKFGESQLDMSGWSNYNSPSLLAQAMTQAGTVEDSAKISQTMRAGQWDTVYGKRGFGGAKTFSMPVVLNQPLYLSQVRGGKVVTVKAFNGTLE